PPPALSPPTAKLDSSAGTPPPLHYSPVASDRGGRESTVDSTPISTPVARGYSRPRHDSKDKDRYVSWHHRLDHPSNNNNINNSNNQDFDDLLFPPDDDDDDTFPLFPSSPRVHSGGMTGPASPINIATPRGGSSSPRNQTSNLTAQLNDAGADARSASNMNGAGRNGNELRPPIGRHESFSMLLGTPQNGSEARPISVRNGPRRESNALAGSYMNGMSWGGLSVGSFIRDE
ncbi:Transcriptional regulator of ribosomal biogenesis proteins, partial [Elasticomyces elasticus]